MSYGSHGRPHSAREMRGADISPQASGARTLWQQLAAVSELAVRQRYHAPWKATGAERHASTPECTDVE